MPYKSTVEAIAAMRTHGQVSALSPDLNADVGLTSVSMAGWCFCHENEPAC